MKSWLFGMLIALAAYVSKPEATPQSVVIKLYRQIVAQHSLGVPKAREMATISPLLSGGLVQRLKTAQACEDDYFRQHPEKDSKPAFPWLELGLFSGANEEALPAAAVVERTEPQKDRSFHVYVRLTYKEAAKAHERPPDPASTFHWQVVAVVKSENDQFVVDDVLFLKDKSKNVESRLSESFEGCKGSHWVGDKR